MFLKVTLYLIIVSISVYAQPAVEFVRSYGGQTTDHLMDIYAVSNGDFVMCGWKEINQGVSRYWVIMIDSHGDVIWSNLYEGGIGFTIIETEEGNLLSAGADANGIKAILCENNGDIIWSNNFGYGRCKAVIELKSGEFLLAGHISIFNQRWGYLAMIDSEGELQWERNYQPQGDGEFNAMRETEGGVVLVGMNNNFREGWLVKADIENEGEIIWVRRHNDHGLKEFQSITSVLDGGFALTGLLQDVQRFGVPRTFFILKIDDDGDEEWINFPNHDEGYHEWATTILGTGGTGFIAAGKQRQGNGRNDGYEPAAFRTNSEGVLRWQTTYELDDLIDIPRCIFNSVVISDDGSILAAGDVSWANENGTDGLVIKLEPDIPEPMILYYTPEDTVFSVLQGDTVQFIARAIDQAGQELNYEWLLNDTLIGEDTTTTVIFEELGEHIVGCVISNDDFSSSIDWRVTSEEFYIDTYSPDSLAWTIRRPREVEFSLGVRAIEDVEPQYRWILTGHRGAWEDVGDAPNLTCEFDRPGEYSLEGRAFHDGTVHSVTWQIAVRSVLYWWTPHERELIVDQHDEIEFNLLPFNPNSDSLDFRWLIDGELDENELDAGIFYSFGDLGDHSVTAIVHDGAEVDTVVWSITVEDPNAVKDSKDRLLPTEVTLYPAAPNPFNSTTTIRYILPQTAGVSLTVYDSAGRLVQTLSEGLTLAGEHRMTLQGAELPAGVYLLRLEVGDVVQSMKVVLLK